MKFQRNAGRPATSRVPRESIVIVTEGIETEVRYFERLKAEYGLSDTHEHALSTLPVLKVNPAAKYQGRVSGLILKGNTPDKVVEVALHILKDSELTSAQSGYTSVPLSVWAVFDTESPQHSHFTKVPHAVDLADNKINLAISRPSFETWLHFHLSDSLSTGVATADHVIKKLNVAWTKAQGGARNKNVIKYTKDDGCASLNHLVEFIFRYKNGVTEDGVPAFLAEAIKRSEIRSKLAFDLKNPHIPKLPSTNVHLLIKSIFASKSLDVISASDNIYQMTFNHPFNFDKDEAVSEIIRRLRKIEARGGDKYKKETVEKEISAAIDLGNSFTVYLYPFSVH